MHSLEEIVEMNKPKPPKEVDLITADGLVIKHKLMRGKCLVRPYMDKSGTIQARQYDLWYVRGKFEYREVVE